jgi:hypothetical protein
MRRLIISICTMFIASQMFAQEAYKNLENKIEKWMSDLESELIVPATKSLKSTDFHEYQYSIDGHFKKGMPQDGSRIIIKDFRNAMILCGVASNYMGQTYVKGFMNVNGKSTTYGTFCVSNTSLGFITNKAKIATELQIKDAEILFCKGSCFSCPAIVSVDASCIALDATGASKDYAGLSCPVRQSDIHSLGDVNMNELLLAASENCSIEWKNSRTFNGTLKISLSEDGKVNIMTLEGDEDNIPFGDAVKVSVKRDGNFVKMKKVYRPEHKLVSEELCVPAALINDENIRNKRFYYQNATDICIENRDGSKYQGKCKISVKDAKNEDGFTPIITMTMGTYTYSNGDMFAGDMSREKCGGIPVSGIMKFADGSYKFGNWISVHGLSKSQISKLESYENPSQVRKAAEIYEWANKYTVYKSDQLIEFFSPDDENISYINCDEVLYEKDTQWYICNRKHNGINKTVFEFKVDSYGRRVNEIVYDYDNYTQKYRPKYMNHFELYSNGEVKTIRTYHYDSEKIYLVINCYSDGTLKSAYRYCTGNRGKLILRLAKEFDYGSIFEDFSTVQYDLNGNYEKKVNWRIGENRYSSAMVNFTPEALDIRQLTKVPIGNDYYRFSGKVEEPSDEEKETVQIHAILFNILSGKKEVVADHLFYPMYRRYPMPPIRDKAAMLDYYDIIFTDELKQRIVENCEIHSIGWRGMAICDCLMSGMTYDDGFKIYDINLESPEEKALWEKAIENRKAQLHPSIQKFIYPCDIIHTKKFTIMIDKVSEKEDGYRYACWKAGSDFKEKPRLVLYNGTLDIVGSMQLFRYSFSNKAYDYIIDQSLGSLFVYENGKLILEDEIIAIE